MRILLLHGWLLERSGSNVYTASLATEWKRAGHEVHVFCQERHPDRYPFIDKAFVYGLEGEKTEIPLSQGDGPGTCVLHRPEIGELLPVFNLDEYEGFSVVRRFVDIAEEELKPYLDCCVNALLKVVEEHPVDVAFANHVFPNPTLLARLKEKTSVPFVVFPHGSAIEYAVKKRELIKEMAEEAIQAADRLIVGNQVVTDRIWRVFPSRKDEWSQKHGIVSVGVDTSLFGPVSRDKRAESIESLMKEGNPGDGKSQAHTQAMFEGARKLDSDEGLLDLVRAERGKYHYTSPDADLEEKLATVDWNEHQVLLYVGKLIAGKGVHDLVMALPQLMVENPDLRVVAVGESTYRETLEILLMALSEGNKFLVESILRQGWALDEREQSALKAAQAYVDKVGMDQLLEWGKASRPVDKFIFTGYLRHARFRHVLPCADVSIFPSEIAEAYPLVLIESICAGVTPIGAYFEGLKDGVDSISEGLPEEIREAMRLRVDPGSKIQQIVDKVPLLMKASPSLAEGWTQRSLQYSWKSVAEKLLTEMNLAIN